PIGPDLRPIFALYCGTASAPGAGRNQSKLSKRRIRSRVLSGFLLKWMSAFTIFTPLYGSTLQRRSAGAPIYSSWIYSCSLRIFVCDDGTMRGFSRGVSGIGSTVHIQLRWPFLSKVQAP